MFFPVLFLNFWATSSMGHGSRSGLVSFAHEMCVLSLSERENRTRGSSLTHAIEEKKKRKQER